ncbi:MAG: fibrobacter succinogenes major paralogous domain-containing protein [Elusimicrobiota bacterium]
MIKAWKGFVLSVAACVMLSAAACPPAQAQASAIGHLKSVVEGLGLPHGIETSLLAKLESAQTSLDRGRDNAAANQLDAFINQVDAQSGKKIIAEDAGGLVETAGEMIDDINGLYPPPSVSSIDPESVEPGYAPFTAVIMGTYFASYDQARIGDVELTDENVISPTEMTATVPAGMEVGAYDVTVYNYWESGTGPGLFTVEEKYQWPGVCGMDNVIDADGNEYGTIRIGSQCWMNENLNVGTMLCADRPDAANCDTLQRNNGILEKYCHRNIAANCDAEGGQYQWNEAMEYVTDEGARGICPPGWHIPTDAELTLLENSVDRPAGTALKAGGSSGFEWLLAGNVNKQGYFTNRGDYGYLASSTEGWQVRSVWVHIVGWDTSGIIRSRHHQADGMSIRCLLD